MLAEPLFEVWMTLFQVCWKSGLVPSVWKESLVVPVPKKSPMGVSETNNNNCNVCTDDESGWHWPLVRLRITVNVPFIQQAVFKSVGSLGTTGLDPVKWKQFFNSSVGEIRTFILLPTGSGVHCDSQAKN